jgi:hypothetical protein
MRSRTATNSIDAGRAAPERPRRGATLLPREHGAYAQLAFPLLTALALTTPAAATLLLALAAIAAFLAHEPLLILVGQRGPRAKRELGATARVRLGALTAAALVTGGAGLWLAPTSARLAALISAALGLGLLALALTDREKTPLGEIWVAGAFASLTALLGLAGGATLETAAIAAGVWWVCFVVAVLAVQGSLSRTRPGKAFAGPAAVALSLAAGLIAIGLALRVPGALPALAVLPVALVSGFWGALRPHPRALRKVGWSMVAAQLSTFALLVGLGRA